MHYHQNCNQISTHASGDRFQIESSMLYPPLRTEIKIIILKQAHLAARNHSSYIVMDLKILLNIHQENQQQDTVQTNSSLLSHCQFLQQKNMNINNLIEFLALDTKTNVKEETVSRHRNAKKEGQLFEDPCCYLGLHSVFF